MAETPTPRTDAAEETFAEGWGPHAKSVQGVPVEFARQLERELSEARKAALEAQEDARRLDFLDRNLKMRMGWKVGIAPAANIGVTSVICLGVSPTNIRDAIDAALASQPPGKTG